MVGKGGISVSQTSIFYYNILVNDISRQNTAQDYHRVLYE